MKHIFFIDPIEKLVTKKDSTILMALTAQEKGNEVFVLFEDDFYIKNVGQVSFDCYKITGDINENFYIENFQVNEKEKVTLSHEVILHMRIDPPYDSRYQRYLWMLDFLESKTAVQVKNNPIGIMKHNEKLEAYLLENSLESYVGTSLNGVKSFVEKISAQGVRELILKPLDLYQGIGVEKISVNELEAKFKAKCDEFKGPVVVQQFDESVYAGEIRSIFYRAKEIGTILKVPQEGEYLANIAQGAKYSAVDLDPKVKNECEEVCKKLMNDGVDLVAFDILGNRLSEVNVTCPGLMVEVSSAMKRNLVLDLF
ncbi:hypothetical protein DAY19_01365 [Halobacteriovorax vibrionivorans]|uniref:Glutathione synthase n=1 Tax=Halobacteriovorax vibrionivorans TaxID=2152716 RepID=A0ABY0IHN3_9BACT|nr:MULTISPECIES: hypothetical protein [Halobacteriovorax]RZF22448.1 hypothetical protein DAY19_01365 [Halobacteriovorax vibrionivorans]TGD47639.1 hypothetical protein EP118_06725 [Halobacteriovorax sp. Y22]